MARVYLDHAASSPLLPEAAAAMLEAAGQAGNPSSTHGSGRAARRLLEDARESLAADLGASPTEVVFTSGGTESDNLAVIGGWRSRAAERPLAVIGATEHPAVLAAARSLHNWIEAPVLGDGVLDLEALESLVTPQVGVVSVMSVNNETGTVQPVEQVVALAKQHGCLVHTDAVQAFGHLPLDFAVLGVDMLTVSAHKLGGPVGVGALLVRRGEKLQPIGFGGGQERDLRSGTVPVSLAVGFAVAARAAVSRLASEHARLRLLQDRLTTGAVSQIPGSWVNGAPGSPAIVNLGFADLLADDLLLLLDEAGFDCSTGSACTAGVHQPSHVLAAMGQDRAAASAALRVSFGPQTTAADVEGLLAVLPGAVGKARAAFSG